MLTATEVHGSESHLVRPDCVYRTGCLTAVPPGFQPVSNAMGVAARFTRLWGPSGTGLAGGGIGGFFSDVLAKMRANKIVRDHRKSQQIAVKRAGGSPGVATLPPQYGSSTPHAANAIPVQGGYAPAFIKAANVGLQLTAQSGQAFYPPGVQPAMVAAAQIAPAAATAPETFVQSMVVDRVGGMVGVRAGNAALRAFVGKRMGSW
jgi:hypothetical protein